MPNDVRVLSVVSLLTQTRILSIIYFICVTEMTITTAMTTYISVDVSANKNYYISAEDQVVVMQMIKGRATTEKGFPSSMYIYPIEQYTTNTQFNIPAEVSGSGLVSIITAASNIGKLALGFSLYNYRHCSLMIC